MSRSSEETKREIAESRVHLLLERTRDKKTIADQAAEIRALQEALAAERAGRRRHRAPCPVQFLALPGLDLNTDTQRGSPCPTV